MADDDQSTEPQGEEGTTPDLGDPGKKALDAERKARREAERQLKAMQTQIKELQDRDKSEVDLLKETLAEREAQLGNLPGQIRQQVVRFASLASKVGYVDPEDALLNLDPDLDLDDVAAVEAALSDLAERKPHLIRQSNSRPADKLPQRPTPAPGAPLGTPEGDLDAKQRAAAALRQLRAQ